MRILLAASVAVVALASAGTAFAQSKPQVVPTLGTRQIVPVAAVDAGVPAPAQPVAAPAPALSNLTSPIPVAPVDTKAAEAVAKELVTQQQPAPAPVAATPAPADVAGDLAADTPAPQPQPAAPPVVAQTIAPPVPAPAPEVVVPVKKPKLYKKPHRIVRYYQDEDYGAVSYAPRRYGYGNGYGYGGGGCD
ncbi:hypothetical protein [Labrys wisconsinensis]|uniref:Uncharacterized protein n=1 Tax=Labrys wisconsinensis TaxID=425677 RepID=A0ABU0J066_9HYPH|nr:hypothetical protein [Labrys wisconsinensis]MDQ0467662.1 hypothetical protein [Labrys wisconsinensis]